MEAAANLLPERPSTVAVALSGGVDSSLAALLLAQAGHRVSGVMMRLWVDEAVRGNAPSGEESARQLCQRLGIPFQVLDLRDEFRREVVSYFGAEYARGRTPNPCLACNRQIKFGALWRWAQAQGAEYLATGHYARRRLVDGAYQLVRAADRRKDQSYVLYMLGQETLAHTLFPLGDLTKGQVRQAAEAAGLAAAQRPESQEICFIPDDDYRGFLGRHYPEAIRPGPIHDTAGREIGQHAGLPFYTVGQRKGLGIAAPEPLYVIEIDAARNRLVVGPAAELGRRALRAEQVRFVSGQPPDGPRRIMAKIRYRAREAAATLHPEPPDSALVILDEPLRDISPGQAVVFYDGEIVLGGGLIERALSQEEWP